MLSTITGDEAKRAREALGASQTAVAAAIGVNRTYYSLFEAGRYVLDEQEQQQLRQFLADALPAPGSGTSTNDDGASTPSNDRARRQPRASSPHPSSAKPDDGTEKAVAALTALRSAAAEPNGLRTKRTASAVGDALAALQPLDYAQLLGLANEEALPKDVRETFPDVEAFNALDIRDMELWESRIIGLLVCDALSAGQWGALNYEALKGVESELRHTFGDQIPDRESLWIWDDEEKHTPRRRAELAPFVAQAAQKRRAPTLDKAAR